MTEKIIITLIVLVFFFVLLPLTQIRNHIETQKGARPSSLETGIATAWLWLRRIVCFSGATLLLGSAVVLIVGTLLGPPGKTDLQTQLGLISGTVVGGLFCIWVGLYGLRRGDNIKSSREFHKEAKQRFRWRW